MTLPFPKPDTQPLEACPPKEGRCLIFTANSSSKANKFITSTCGQQRTAWCGWLLFESQSRKTWDCSRISIPCCSWMQFSLAALTATVSIAPELDAGLLIRFLSGGGEFSFLSGVLTTAPRHHCFPIIITIAGFANPRIWSKCYYTKMLTLLYVITLPFVSYLKGKTT